jgi:hypothetical protein
MYTEEPDHSDIPEIKYDWENTCYREPRKKYLTMHPHLLANE